MKKILLKSILYLLIVSHMIGIVFVILSFILLPLYAPWYTALPLMIWIVHLMMTRIECPITTLENWLRRKLGMKQIPAFVGYYIVRPIKQVLRMTKKNTASHN